MPTKAVITGWGKCVPPVELTNGDLEKLSDTNDQWIVERTGIKSRRISHVDGTDLAELAGRRALAAADMEPEDLDLILVASTTPDLICPSVAAMVQERLGAVNCAAFDLNAACSGFIYATANAAGMIESGFVKKALVIGAEKLHGVMDYRDRSTSVLFGDGAGAAVYEAIEGEAGVLAVDLGADGSKGHTMVLKSMGTNGNVFNSLPPEEMALHFEGQAVFKIAVQGIAASVTRVLEDSGFSAEDVDVVIPHQANARIVDAATRLLKVDEAKVFSNIENLGNTGAASIPMAISDALDSNRINPGDIVVLSAFGGGVTWGSIVMRWGERTERLKIHDGELPPTDASVFEILEPNLRFFAELHGLDPDAPIV
tara:strand:- start:2292 stop:3401 length:1110 start_codon:yes stop_codon:yes gene_type:complete